MFYDVQTTDFHWRTPNRQADIMKLHRFAKDGLRIPQLALKQRHHQFSSQARIAHS